MPRVAGAVALAASLCLGLSGCLSTSRATAVALDDSKPAYATEDCQSAIRATEVHETLHTGRIIATPVLLVLTAGAAAPLLVGSNIALDAADRVDASKLSEACGGPGKTTGEIAGDVAGNAALGAVTGAALDGVAGGGDGLASRLSRFLFGGATGTASR
jgi:hypothetical protein